jgi:hypothetical protein
LLTINDAVTNRMMRDIVEFANSNPRPGQISPENRQQLDEGYVVVGDGIVSTLGAQERRDWLERRPSDFFGGEWDEGLKEHEDNEFYMWTETSFSDPGWRVEIFEQGMSIVQELTPQLAAIASHPVQIVLAIGSGLEEDPEEGSDSTSGVVKFLLIRPGSTLDARINIEDSANPLAVFTFESTLEPISQ